MDYDVATPGGLVSVSISRRRNPDFSGRATTSVAAHRPCDAGGQSVFDVACELSSITVCKESAAALLSVRHEGRTTLGPITRIDTKKTR